MSFTTDLVVGFAQLLADADVGFIWQPDGAYVVGEDYGYGGYETAYGNGGTGLFVMGVPSIPDRLVTLSPYPLGDDAVYADSLAGLQVRSRAAGEDPRGVMDLDDTVADVLLGRFPMTLPTGVHVTTLERTSATPLGQDANQRWSWSSNYRLGLHRPGTHRL